MGHRAAKGGHDVWLDEAQQITLLLKSQTGRQAVLEEFERGLFRRYRQAFHHRQVANHVRVDEGSDELDEGDSDLARRVFFDELEGCLQLLRKTAQNGCIRVGGWMSGQHSGLSVDVSPVQAIFTRILGGFKGSLATLT